jgi:hypothetical protein
MIDGYRKKRTIRQVDGRRFFFFGFLTTKLKEKRYLSPTTTYFLLMYDPDDSGWMDD